MGYFNSYIPLLDLMASGREACSSFDPRGNWLFFFPFQFVIGSSFDLKISWYIEPFMFAYSFCKGEKRHACNYSSSTCVGMAARMSFRCAKPNSSPFFKRKKRQTIGVQ